MSLYKSETSESKSNTSLDSKVANSTKDTQVEDQELMHNF